MFNVIGAEVAKLSIEQLRGFLGNSLSTKEAETIEDKENLIEDLEAEYEWWKNYEPGFWGKSISLVGGGVIGFLTAFDFRRNRSKQGIGGGVGGGSAP